MRKLTIAARLYVELAGWDWCNLGWWRRRVRLHSLFKFVMIG